VGDPTPDRDGPNAWLTTFRTAEREYAVIVAAHTLFEAAQCAVARWARHGMAPGELVAIENIGPALLAVDLPAPPRGTSAGEA